MGYLGGTDRHRPFTSAFASSTRWLATLGTRIIEGGQSNPDY
jgi:hypothetical protein